MSLGGLIVTAIAALSVLAAIVLTACAGSDHPAPVSSYVVVGYPSSVVAPSGTVAALPQQAAVGRGALVYTSCAEGCPIHLVTVSGEQYAITPVRSNPGRQVAWPGDGPDLNQDVRLSPDGRWLLQRARAGLVIRDLTSTNQFEYQDFTETGPWSANGRWLVLDQYEQHDAAGQGAYLLDLTTGKAGALKGFPKSETSITGVLDDGRLLVPFRYGYEYADPDPRTELLRFFSPVTGELVNRVTADFGVSADFPLTDHNGAWSTMGDSLLAIAPSHTSSADTLTVVSMRTGEVTARWPMPEGLRLQGFDDGQVLLLGGDGPSHAGSVKELWLLDPQTGQAHLVCRVTGAKVLVTRG